MTREGRGDGLLVDRRLLRRGGLGFEAGHHRVLLAVAGPVQPRRRDVGGAPDGPFVEPAEISSFGVSHVVTSPSYFERFSPVDVSLKQLLVYYRRSPGRRPAKPLSGTAAPTL